MIFKLVMVMVVGVAMAAPEDLYGAPGPQPVYNQIPYNFEYGVKDEYAGTDFSQAEESDGKTVTGSYTVQLPDGRKQTVTYVADDYGGYRAEVSYYGEAQYPYEYGPPITFKPQPYQPQPSYKPPYQR
ncbi:cuticle protein 19-like [Cherax quadricarinatus]|uniref:cuticle protein 19-like n=1 Tax=Cherax quadricarinatus TaxID=27406 RepID=UPI00387ED088